MIRHGKLLKMNTLPHIHSHKITLPKWYNHRVYIHATKGKAQGMSTVNIDYEQVGKAVGIGVSSIALISGLARFACWIKRKRQERIDRKNQILDKLKQLCKGQDELYERMDRMDNLRELARIDDAKVRADLYLGQIAMVAAVKELGRHMDIHINGEVEKYYQQNIEALRKGLGMAPLNACAAKEEKHTV